MLLQLYNQNANKRLGYKTHKYQQLKCKYRKTVLGVMHIKKLNARFRQTQ